MLFSLFVRNADMPAGLSFLLIVLHIILLLISFALICAIAHQRIIFLKDERLLPDEFMLQNVENVFS